MGQKTHPTGFRIAITEPWRSRWYATAKDFPRLLLEDQKIRQYVTKNWAFAQIPRVEIERTGDLVTVFLHTARPGILIGKKGAKVDKLREDLEKLTGKPVRMKIIEIHRPELEATLVADAISEQIIKRINYRRALKKAAEASMAAGAKGIKILVAGRLGGAEMARVGEIRKGRIPTTTLRAQVDFGTSTARTTYGAIGVKVWIFKGEFGPDETTGGLLPVRTAAERTF
ncbi:MAG: 30S ribosomal protein S3 [Planctomycetota bacterium]